MAKESMITRTIKTTAATVLCLDIETGEPCNRTFTLSGERTKEKDVIKEVSALLADYEPSVKAVHLVDTVIVEQLYGMPESTFLEFAKPFERKAKADTLTPAANADNT